MDHFRSGEVDHFQSGRSIRFQTWRQNHPDGYFLNRRAKTAGTLHRVKCPHPGDTTFGAQESGQDLTRLPKVCAVRLETLQQWVEREGLVDVSSCKTCAPTAAEGPSALTDEQDGEPPPSSSAPEPHLLEAEVFLRALDAARPRMNDGHLAMLRAHYFADDNLITAAELASAAGFGDYRAANAQYGALGALMRENSPILREVAGQESHAIASFIPPSGPHRHWRWQMHPGLVEALGSLGWFSDDDPVDVSELQLSAAQEGQLRRRQILHRHREQRLRLAKLEQARTAHPQRRVVCEVPGCGFDFEAVYGQLGDGYAEVHHLVPLAALEPGTLTTLADLVVVCSNCHRMIHRGGECRALNSLITTKA